MTTATDAATPTAPPTATTQHFPPEIFHSIHTFCDIDSRRNLERSLGWNFIAYKVPIPTIDYVKIKKDAAEVEYDPDYPSYSVFTISISHMSSYVTYDIELIIHSPWMRSQTLEEEGEEGEGSTTTTTWSMDSEEYLFADARRGIYEYVAAYWEGPFGTDSSWLCETEQIYGCTPTTSFIDETRTLRIFPPGWIFHPREWEDIPVAKYRTTISYSTPTPIITQQSEIASNNPALKR